MLKYLMLIPVAALLTAGAFADTPAEQQFVFGFDDPQGREDWEVEVEVPGAGT